MIVLWQNNGMFACAIAHIWCKCANDGLQTYEMSAINNGNTSYNDMINIIDITIIRRLVDSKRVHYI